MLRQVSKVFCSVWPGRP